MTVRSSTPATWLALATPPIAWYLYQQGTGALVRVACAAGGPTGLILGCLALAACGAVAWTSRPRRREGDGEGRAETRRLLDWVAMAGAGLFALAIW